MSDTESESSYKPSLTVCHLQRALFKLHCNIILKLHPCQNTSVQLPVSKTTSSRSGPAPTSRRQSALEYGLKSYLPYSATRTITHSKSSLNSRYSDTTIRLLVRRPYGYFSTTRRPSLLSKSVHPKNLWIGVQFRVRPTDISRISTNALTQQLELSRKAISSYAGSKCRWGAMLAFDAQCQGVYSPREDHLQVSSGTRMRSRHISRGLGRGQRMGNSSTTRTLVFSVSVPVRLSMLLFSFRCDFQKPHVPMFLMCCTLMSYLATYYLPSFTLNGLILMNFLTASNAIRCYGLQG